MENAVAYSAQARPDKIFNFFLSGDTKKSARHETSRRKRLQQLMPMCQPGMSTDKVFVGPANRPMWTAHYRDNAKSCGQISTKTETDRACYSMLGSRMGQTARNKQHWKT